MSSDLLHTPLHALHQSLTAKLVPFASYSMPVQYTQGIIKEHLHVRNAAGLFDVSHMGQVTLTAESIADVASFLETVLPSDIHGLAVNEQRYSVLLNDNGGIVDDLMCVNRGDDFLLVINASRKQEDIAYLQEKIQQYPKQITLTELNDRALLALQGPKAINALNDIGVDATSLRFMQGMFVEVGCIDNAVCYITRSGYTGEDGVEISVPADQAEALAKQLLALNDVEPIGLGARDSLRLEAGLCLYGNDINEATTPVDASLSWVVSKVRRKDGERAGGYAGHVTIDAQLENGASVKRVGLTVLAKTPVRQGVEIQDANNTTVGVVTSGGYSPSLEQPIAMATINKNDVQLPLQAIVRGKAVPVEITPLPFVAHNYVR